MLEGPHHRVQHELERLFGHGEECSEAVGVHSTKEVEEVGAVLRVVLEIFGDHGKGALEHGVQDARDVASDDVTHLVDDDCHERKDLYKIISYSQLG